MNGVTHCCVFCDTRRHMQVSTTHARQGRGMFILSENTTLHFMATTSAMVVTEWP